VAYLVFAIFLLFKWKQFTLWVKAALLLVALTPLLVSGWLYFSLHYFQYPSDELRESDYMGGCAVERYINGDCVFDYVIMSNSKFYPYPLVTENDGIWKRLESYSKEDLMKIAEQELERSGKGQYKGQQRQIERIRSFIDILSKR
jgi:hypothetical protein